MSLKKSVACVKSHKSFLITSHANLEGDALGSELAFYRLLEKMGKEAVIVNEDGLAYGYEFMPDADKIKKFNQRFVDKPVGFNFDCFVVLDCSDLRRTGEVYRMNTGHKTTLNIDHHISNENFGDINWVEPNTSSCCEMIYKLYKSLGIPFDKDTATALYVGMLTDTGSFRYSNTSSFTHKAVSELLRYDLDIRSIYNNIYESTPFEDMKLLIKLLPHIRRKAQGKVIWFEVRHDMLRGKKLSFDLTDYMLTFARSIKGVEVAVLFKENLGVKDEIRVNLRSQGKVDVNKIASFFGGGGHKSASGCTIRGKIAVVRRRVLARIMKDLP